MEYSYLNDILIILSSTVMVVVLFNRIGLPPILAYLVVGITVGPYGLSWVYDSAHIRVLAEFGVVFLLFTIGLEFSVALLMRMRAAVLVLGSTQVFLTTAFIMVGALLVDMNIESALVLGAVMAMSSTALVTKQLADQAELHTRHGRNSIGILLFQDMMVVPFLILIAMLSGDTETVSAATVSIALIEGVVALLLIFACGRWVLKPLLREVASFHSAEAFTLTVLLVVLCSAWVTHLIGLTFALGAFVAGVMLSETEFRHQVESEIRPFRDVLLGLFFVSIGMMLDLSMLPEIWPSALILFVILIVIKSLLVTLFCKLSGWNNAVSIRTGLILAHGGEFGFAILILAMDGNILHEEEGQMILAAMLLSMAIAPLVIRHNSLITARLFPYAMRKSKADVKKKIISKSQSLNHHVIVCGYGRVGKQTAFLLSEQSIPYIAIDLNAEQVQKGVTEQRLVSYGDAGSLELLHACGLAKASALVVSMIDFNTAIKIITRVRSINTEIPIIVRTRKEIHLYHFYQAGASDVVADIFGSDHMITLEMMEGLGISGKQT